MDIASTEVGQLPKQAPTHLHPVKVGDLTIDRIGHKVMFDEKPILLSPKEYRILFSLALLNFTRRRVARDQWMREAYGVDDPPSGSFDVLLHRLRKKLEDSGTSVYIHHTSVGYYFGRKDLIDVQISVV